MGTEEYNLHEGEDEEPPNLCMGRSLTDLENSLAYGFFLFTDAKIGTLEEREWVFNERRKVRAGAIQNSIRTFTYTEEEN